MLHGKATLLIQLSNLPRSPRVLSNSLIPSKYMNERDCDSLYRRVIKLPLDNYDYRLKIVKVKIYFISCKTVFTVQ